MPTHAEQRPLPYSAQQMFDLVADIDRYAEFLPWCTSARIWKREEGGNGLEIVHADLVIGYKLFQERFTSKVTLNRTDQKIRVEYLKGPLKYLSNEWDFLPNQSGGCIIDFFVDFEFKNPVFQRVMGVFFNEAVKRMVAAFEARARQLYG